MTREQPVEAQHGTGRSGPARFIPPPSSIIWAVAIALTALTIYVSRELVLLMVLSGGLAYLINPLVKKAESAAIKRELAVTALFLAMIALLIVAGYFLVPRLRTEVQAISQGFPSFTERLDAALDAIQQEIVMEYPAAHRVFPSRETRYDRLNAFIEHQTSNLPNLVSHLATIVLAVVLIPFFSYFLLRDSHKIIQFLMDRLPAVHIETSVAVWCEVDRIIGRYLRGLAMDGMVISAAAAFGLWTLGVNYPLLLGVFSGLANVVPYLGPVLGGGTAMLVALIQFKSLTPLAKVLILYLFIKLLDDVVFQPTTIGKSVHLHPILLLASVIVGGHALGVIGMIMAVPAVTVLQETTKLLLERRRYHLRALTPRSKKGVHIQPYVC